jgi:hypothetical protein
MLERIAIAVITLGVGLLGVASSKMQAQGNSAADSSQVQVVNVFSPDSPNVHLYRFWEQNDQLGDTLLIFADFIAESPEQLVATIQGETPILLNMQEEGSGGNAVRFKIWSPDRTYGQPFDFDLRVEDDLYNVSITRYFVRPPSEYISIFSCYLDNEYSGSSRLHDETIWEFFTPIFPDSLPEGPRPINWGFGYQSDPVRTAQFINGLHEGLRGNLGLELQKNIWSSIAHTTQDFDPELLLAAIEQAFINPEFASFYLGIVPYDSTSPIIPGAPNNMQYGNHDLEASDRRLLESKRIQPGDGYKEIADKRKGRIYDGLIEIVVGLPDTVNVIRGTGPGFGPANFGGDLEGPPFIVRINKSDVSADSINFDLWINNPNIGILQDSLTINQQPGYALVGTYFYFTAGEYFPDQGIVGVSVSYGSLGIQTDEPLHLPSEFSLSQNYPNPFNPSTTIEFDVPECGSTRTKVRLDIYDMRGWLVRPLVDELSGPGRYKVQWDGKDKAGGNAGSGVYFCRIEAGHFKSTRKLLLAR